MASLNRVRDLSRKFYYETFSKRANSLAVKTKESNEPSADDLEQFEATYGKGAKKDKFKPTFYLADEQKNSRTTLDAAKSRNSIGFKERLYATLNRADLSDTQKSAFALSKRHIDITDRATVQKLTLENFTDAVGNLDKLQRIQEVDNNLRMLKALKDKIETKVHSKPGENCTRQFYNVNCDLVKSPVDIARYAARKPFAKLVN